MIDTGDRTYKAAFDVRSVNLTKIDKAIDLEILIAEADGAIMQILSQIQDGFGDAYWLQDAKRAQREIEHKKALAEKKLAVVKAAQATSKTAQSPDSLFRSRFMKAAQEILPCDVYTVIFEAARAGEIKVAA